MGIYDAIFTHGFSKIDAERAHTIGFTLIRWVHATGVGAVLRRITQPAPELSVKVWGRQFPSPFGLAAGFDKEAKGVQALTNLGFGFIEVGTITGQAQPGNEKPRLFRLVKDLAVINRMGFNNPGAAEVAGRLKSLRQSSARQPLVGINIGKTKKVSLEQAQDDYATSARALAPFADYLVINVSSPNTPGLRSLQTLSALEPIVQRVKSEVATVNPGLPVAIKIAPDMDDEEVADLARFAVEQELGGIVAVNTTVAREGLVSSAEEIADAGPGGLSGAPLQKRALEVLRVIRQVVPEDFPVISVGGVETAQHVWDRLENGATLVQGYTAFLYQGPFWVHSINRGLRALLRTSGIAAISELATVRTTSDTLGGRD